jgi:glycosyltransferase involved in cell wall biosynthesis
VLNSIYKESYYNIICLKRTKTLSIVLFSHTSELDGAGRSLLDLAKSLLAKGIICNVILPSSGTLKDKLQSSGSGVRVAPTSLCKSWWWATQHVAKKNFLPLLHLHRSLLDLVDSIRMFEPDYIISQTIVSPWGAICAEILSIPHALSAREYGTLDHNLNFIYGFEETIDAFYQSSDILLCITKDVKKELFGSNCQKKCEVIYSGIELDSANNRLKSSKDINIYFNQTSGPIVCLPSTIHPGKGQLDLVRAILKLRDQGINVRCLLVGLVSDKDYVAQLDQIINDSNFSNSFSRLNFTDDIYEILSQTDCIVSCSRHEALGRTLIEASLLQKPIIYVNSGGPKEIFQQGVHGLAYQPGDYQQLAACILQIIEDPSSTENRVKAARLLCQNLFNINTYSTKVLEKIRFNFAISKDRTSHSKPVLELLQQQVGANFEPIKWRPKFYWSNVFELFSEQHVFFSDPIQFGFFECKINLTIDDCNSIRFDPIEGDFIAIDSLSIEAQDAVGNQLETHEIFLTANSMKTDQQWFFTTSDPQISMVFTKPIKSLRIFGNIMAISNDMLIKNILNLTQAVDERDGQIANVTQAVVERDGYISHLENQLNTILSSNSWRLTKPLRFLRRNRTWARKLLLDMARRTWRVIPLSIQSKQNLKNLIFKSLPLLFRHNQVYRNWQSFQYPATSGTPGQVNVTQNLKNLSPSDGPVNQYVSLLIGPPIVHKPVKLICFYLPQFHTIPENDEWWGEGFTEWTNVQPAQPQFDGHYQPHVPDELGYYNLLDSLVQQRQVELAKLYGIEGFCFYFYWFGGKRLLEAPIENYLNDKTLDLPFCLCWANENWSRRWDGLDSEILMAQQHSVEDDLAFIQHVARYMRDSRYIRINGKPLLLVYRPSLLPLSKATASRWRDWCRVNEIGEIYLAYTQSFENVDPEKYGFDAAVEFPPNNSVPPNITGSVTPIGEDFGSTVYDWRVFVERSEHYKQQPYTLFRSVCPSWDNTARRKNRATVFLNSTPALYQRWLENAIRDTQAHRPNPDEQLIFVNAWNEWAEGTHLEPDAHYGYAWLQATRNALSGETYIPDNKRRVILVAHDAYPHGAQFLSANLARTLNQGMGFHVDLVCLGDGQLMAEYAKWATVHILSDKDPCGSEAKEVAKRLYQLGHRTALVNTTVSGYFLETLVAQGIKCVALIHELRGVLDQNGLHGHARAIAAHASKVVFPAAEVRQSFNEVSPIPPGKTVIRPQGLYKRRDKTQDRESYHVRLRQKLDLPDDAQIVLAVGYADHRKGIDLFVAAGLAVAERLPKAYWVWIGHWEQTMQHAVEQQLAKFPELKGRFIFPGLQTDTDLFYGGADVFALTSREDPFPSVVLEALDANVPVVGFEGAGGFISLLNEGCGKLVPKENAEAFALAVADLLEKPAEKAMLGQCGADLIRERFSFRHYVYDLLDLLGIGLARVSAIVPNYNYAHYLPERLESIIKQDYPIYEIVFLDDCSRDESIHIAEKVLHESGIDYKIVSNDANSGSVFRQWRKGVEMVTGTHVWLAEADDSCDYALVSELLKGYRTPGVVLSYCESKQIDKKGNVLANNYLAYVSDVDARHWLTPFVVDGISEIVNSLSVKNTIPNVSAALFEKVVLTQVLANNFDMISSYRIAGDWLTYVLVLNGGRLAFSPMSLNKHRRHSNGLTISNINKSQLEEIRRMQEYIAKHHNAPVAKVEQAKRYMESLQKEHGIAVH